VKSAAPRPLVPPARVFVTLASLAAAIVMVRMGLLEPLVGGIVDAAVRNIITLILAFSAQMAVLGWFLFQSGHPTGLKRLVAIGLLAAVGLACAVFRIERVSGDLVPQLAFRWAPPRDRLLPQAVKPAVEAAAAAAWTEAPGDFSRFLGPQGAASLEGPILDPSWESRPPEQLWRRPIGAGWSGFATCGDHAVTLEQRGDDEIISCQSVATGDVEWTVSVPGRHETVLGGVGPRSTPTIAGGAVYTTGATGWLHAIDGASGRVSHAGSRIGPSSAAEPWGPRNPGKSADVASQAGLATASAAGAATFGRRRSGDGAQRNVSWGTRSPDTRSMRNTAQARTTGASRPMASAHLRLAGWPL
jgi:hypothetical protein